METQRDYILWKHIQVMPHHSIQGLCDHFLLYVLGVLKVHQKNWRITVSVFLPTLQLTAVLLKCFRLHLHCYIQGYILPIHPQNGPKHLYKSCTHVILNICIITHRIADFQIFCARMSSMNPQKSHSYPPCNCNTLQHTVTLCNTLQHIAAHCRPALCIRKRTLHIHNRALYII